MSEPDDTPTLESALARTEADADEALAATRRLQKLLMAIRKSARSGDLIGMRRRLGETEETMGEALVEITSLRDGWAFRREEAEEAYFSSGAYARELVGALRAERVDVHEQGDALACYPSLLRIVPRSRGVKVDRRTVRTARPSYLAAALGAAQRKGTGFKAEPFLETLLAAYRLLAREDGEMVRLVDVHRALTLLPAARAEYAQQDFARDVYLLDASGVSRTKDGSRARLSSGATASRRPSELLTVVTREGVERTYYGIELSTGG